MYNPIKKTLDNGGQFVIYPFEYIDNRTRPKFGGIVNSFRKLRIDITLPFDSSIVDMSKIKHQQPFFDKANEYLNSFLLHCKTKSKQYWLQPIFFRPFNVTTFNYDIKFVDQNKNILSEYGGKAGGIIFVNVGINGEMWSQITDNIINDTEPSVVDFHMEEARHALFSRNINISIINAAIAFEIYTSQFCNEYAQKIGKGTDSKFESFVKNRGDSFVIKYFKKIIPRLSSRDLSREHKDKYLSINHLFRARNSIVHLGKAFYKEDSGTEFNVDYEKAHKLFFTAIDVMKWIRSIDVKIAERLKCFLEIK